MAEIWDGLPWKTNRHQETYQELAFPNLVIKRYVSKNGEVTYRNGYGQLLTSDAVKIELMFRPLEISAIRAALPRTVPDTASSSTSSRNYELGLDKSHYRTSTGVAPRVGNRDTDDVTNRRDLVQTNPYPRTGTALPVRPKPAGPTGSQPWSPGTIGATVQTREPLSRELTVQTNSSMFRQPGERRQSYSRSRYSRTSSYLRYGGVPPTDFKKQPSSFFTQGRVFQILWSEPKGENGDGTHNVDPSQAYYEKRRPMVVFKSFHGHCWCVPIYTHGSQGVLKPGLNPSAISQHAVIYDERKNPVFDDAEVDLGMTKRPIAVTISEEHLSLDERSRVRFDIIITVQYNWKVGDYGMVVDGDRDSLLKHVLSNMVTLSYLKSLR